MTSRSPPLALPFSPAAPPVRSSDDPSSAPPRSPASNTDPLAVCLPSPDATPAPRRSLVRPADAQSRAACLASTTARPRLCLSPALCSSKPSPSSLPPPSSSSARRSLASGSRARSTRSGRSTCVPRCRRELPPAPLRCARSAASAGRRLEDQLLIASVLASPELPTVFMTRLLTSLLAACLARRPRVRVRSRLRSTSTTRASRSSSRSRRRMPTATGATGTTRTRPSSCASSRWSSRRLPVSRTARCAASKPGSAFRATLTPPPRARPSPR